MTSNTWYGVTVSRSGEPESVLYEYNWQKFEDAGITLDALDDNGHKHKVKGVIVEGLWYPIGHGGTFDLDDLHEFFEMLDGNYHVLGGVPLLMKAIVDLHAPLTTDTLEGVSVYRYWSEVYDAIETNEIMHGYNPDSWVVIDKDASAKAYVADMNWSEQHNDVGTPYIYVWWTMDW